MRTLWLKQYVWISTIALMMLHQSTLSGQNRNVNRPAVVAGQFYPETKQDLRDKLVSLYASVTGTDSPDLVRALVVPHAGYEFSGEIAARAYNQLADLSQYENIFIIASSHRISIGRASIYSQGDYLTPMGRVSVNQKIVNQLLQEDCIVYEPKAHADEHSIEVQLPFLQFFGKMPPIIPIVLASQVPDVAADLAEALRPWYNQRNLFIISADFSHYPRYEEAKKIDSLTAKAFCSGDPELFLKQLAQNDQGKTRGLATSMCAWPAGLVLLELMKQDTHTYFDQLGYANSGDHPLYGDKRRVVGYHAIALRDKREPAGFYLSDLDKQQLLASARKTLQVHLSNSTNQEQAQPTISDHLRQKAGAFVSLKVNGKLRGCLGSFSPTEPLHVLIPDLTISSATHDSRFLPVSIQEVTDISIEISVLTPMKRIENIDEIILGKHGIYIKKGSKSGTFLPQVADETGWTLDEFLGHCSADKAGLGWTGWKSADVFVYEAIVFKEKK